MHLTFTKWALQTFSKLNRLQTLALWRRNHSHAAWRSFVPSLLHRFLLLWFVKTRRSISCLKGQLPPNKPRTKPKTKPKTNRCENSTVDFLSQRPATSYQAKNQAKNQAKDKPMSKLTIDFLSQSPATSTLVFYNRGRRWSQRVVNNTKLIQNHTRSYNNHTNIMQNHECV